MTDVHDRETIARITALMPSFAPVFARRDSLRAYSAGVAQGAPTAEQVVRQQHVIAIIDDVRQRLFGSDVPSARLPVPAPGSGLCANIVDHQKIMSNPVQASVPIVANLDRILRGDRTALLSFATAAVGLEEPFNRRAIRVEGIRINLYPARHRNAVVYWAPRQPIAIRARAERTGAWHRLSPAARDGLSSIDALIGSLDYRGCRGLSDQITIVNRHLWRRLFATDLRADVPDLLQLDFEDVARGYLLHLLAHAPDAYPIRMLLDAPFRAALLAAFDGLVGAWDTRRGIGSVLFWAERDGHRVALRMTPAGLERSDTGVVTPLDRSTLIDNLTTRTWMPGQIVTFVALVLHAGILPIMGWSLEFVTRLAATFRALAADHAPGACADIAALRLDNMNLFSILKARTGDPDADDVSVFDVILRGGLTRSDLERIGTRPYAAYLTPLLGATLAYAEDKYAASSQPAA